MKHRRNGDINGLTFHGKILTGNQPDFPTKIMGVSCFIFPVKTNQLMTSNCLICLVLGTLLILEITQMRSMVLDCLEYESLEIPKIDGPVVQGFIYQHHGTSWNIWDMDMTGNVIASQLTHTVFFAEGLVETTARNEACWIYLDQTAMGSMDHNGSPHSPKNGQLLLEFQSMYQLHCRGSFLVPVCLLHA